MPSHRRSDLPGDSSELAKMIANASQPSDCADRAMEKLWPLIDSIARKTAASFPLRMRSDLSSEAGAIIWSRLGQFDPARGRFEDWCRTVLYHYNVDQFRKTQSSIVRPAFGGSGNTVADLCSGNDALDTDSEEQWKRCLQLRVTLDRLSWQPSRGVHYFAVLLLQLRLAMARCLTPQQKAEYVLWKQELPELIEMLLPWTLDESRTCLKPDWPLLSDLWAAVHKVICQPASRIDAPAFCQIVQRQLPDSTHLTADVWNHWVSRAKREARNRLQDEDVWHHCFGRLLPDR